MNIDTQIKMAELTVNQLNYHHLYYFYTVVREGSIASAAKRLHLTPQTISGQLSAFETYLGAPLFDRLGKRLQLNETGKIAFSYAEDIFALGNELQQSLHTRHQGQRRVFSLGVTDVIPKVFSFDLLKACFDLDDPFKIICREGDLDSLLAELALNKLDLVLSDRPLPPGSPFKAYGHLLGEAGLTFYADQTSANDLRSRFPHSLDQHPFLICSDKSSQKVNLLSWFDEVQIKPNIVAEFDDSALMKYFGQSGYGIFCTPTTIEQHVTEQYQVAIIGRTQDVKERYYAISPDRKLKHPAVNVVVEMAKSMFQPLP